MIKSGVRILAIALVAIMLASAFAGVVNASVEYPNVEPEAEANDPIDVEDRGIEAQHHEPLGDIEHRAVRDEHEREFERESAQRERERFEHESPWRDGEDAHEEGFGELGHPYTQSFEDERYFEELYLNPEFDRDGFARSGDSRCEFTPAPDKQSRTTSHDPIYINGNSAFAENASIEGWVGNGTEGEPYVIEN